jgi:ribonuclease BN (tRNA processing enzyme)
MPHITVTLLGTNGWYSSRTGNTLSVFIQTPKVDIILDAGDGIHKIADICQVIDKPVFLLLSHLHLDHICGLHTLVRMRFMQGLTIYGPPGTRSALTSFIGYPFTVPIAELPYHVTISELPEGKTDTPLKITTAFLVHTQPVYGYRLDIGKIITFCTDTGPCDNYINLARNADLLISECSYLPGQESPQWPHLNPETVIVCAKEAGVKKLALVHFAADLYTTVAMREEIREKAPAFPGLIIGEDNQVIEV